MHGLQLRKGDVCPIIHICRVVAWGHVTVWTLPLLQAVHSNDEGLLLLVQSPVVQSPNVEFPSQISYQAEVYTEQPL